MTPTYEKSGPFRLMDLPPEIRLLILRHLMQPRGTVKITANLAFSKGKGVHRESLSLLAVNQTIRSEMQTDFYINQTFLFTSLTAIDNYLARIGKYHSNHIRKVMLGEKVCKKLTQKSFKDFIDSVVQWLSALETLQIAVEDGRFRSQRWCIDDPAIPYYYTRQRNQQATPVRPGMSSLAVLDAAPQFTAGRACIFRRPWLLRKFRYCVLFTVRQEMPIETQLLDEPGFWMVPLAIKAEESAPG